MRTTVLVQVKVVLDLPAEEDYDGVISEMSYHMTSNTPGAYIVDTEIVEAGPIYPEEEEVEPELPIEEEEPDKCPECQGFGTVTVDIDPFTVSTCQACTGLGQFAAGKTIVAEFTSCLSCNGSGDIADPYTPGMYHDCGECNGTGKCT